MEKSEWMKGIAWAILAFTPQGMAQSLISGATDETMRAEAVEIRDWNMADMTGGLYPPPPASEPSYYKGERFFLYENHYSSCFNTTLVSVFIHSDPVSGTGQPEVYPFVRLRNFLPGLHEWGNGGSIGFQCGPTGNDFHLSLEHSRSIETTNPQNGSIFWNSTRNFIGLRNSAKFGSATGRRGWLKLEYWL